MTNRVTQIEQRLRDAFSPEDLQVVDDSHLHAGHEGARGGGGHYSVTIVSAAFTSHNTVKRHRMVYDALQDMMHKQIHALSIRALTPDEL